MAYTIEVGWWIVPFIITGISLISAAFMSRDEGFHGDYAAIGNAMVALVVWGAAIIVSLLVWLLWAVLV